MTACRGSTDAKRTHAIVKAAMGAMTVCVEMTVDSATGDDGGERTSSHLGREVPAGSHVENG